MTPIVRSVLALLLGVIVGVVLISATEMVEHLVFPPPEGIDPTDRDAMKALIASMPVGGFVILLLGWFLGSFAGAWVAARVAGRLPVLHGLIVGFLFLLAAIANMLRFPHPTWVWIVGCSLFLPAAYLGAWLAEKKPRVPVQLPGH